MTYRGHIQNGQIVLDEPADLPDGTAVSVEPLPPSSRGLASAIVDVVQTWDGPSEELDQLLADVQQLRDQDTMPRRQEIE